MSKPYRMKLFKMNLQLFGKDPMFDNAAILAAMTQAAEAPPAETPPADPAPETPLDPAPAAPQPTAQPFDMEALATKLQESIANGFANSQQPQPQSNDPAAPEPTPEELEEINSRLRDEMLDNPIAFLEKYGKDIEDKLKAEFEGRIKPFEEQAQNAQRSQEIAEALAAFKDAHLDFDDHLDLISEYVTQRPHRENDPDLLADAYNYAKAQRATEPNEDEFISKAASDERVKQQVINEYLKGVRNGQPPAMVSSTGTSPVATPPLESPKDFKQAAALFTKQLVGNNGN